MRTIAVVPPHEEHKLLAEPIPSEGHLDSPRPLAFHRSEEPLDDRDAPVLPDGAVAHLDLPPPTPLPEALAEEHRFLVADEVARCALGVSDRPTEEGPQRGRVGLPLEDHEALDPAGEVVEDHGDPEAERPLLRESTGEPRDPEAQARRDCTQIDVPDMVWPIRGDDGTGHSDGDRLGESRLILQEPAHGRRRQVQSSAAEHLGDLDLPQARTKELQSSDDVADQVREFVDRNGDLQERTRSSLVDPRLPGTEGRRGDVEAFRGLARRPASGRPESRIAMRSSGT